MSIEARMRAYLGALVVVVLMLALVLALSGHGFGTWWVVVALAIVAGVAERGRVRLSDTLEESISLIPTLFVAVLFGPLPAMFVSAASLISDFRRPYMKWAT